LENGGELQVTYGSLGKWRRATSELWATWKMAGGYKFTKGHLQKGGGLQVNYGQLGKWWRATSDLRATWKMAESYK